MSSYILDRGRESFQRLDASDIPDKQFDLIYNGPEHEARAFDLYRPDEKQKRMPLIIVIASGGWYFGRPSSIHLGAIASTAVKRGYALASIAVTDSLSKKFPYQIQETICALRHMREHAEEYCIDPDRMYLSGSSSGGHTALMTAFAGQNFCDGDMPKVAGLSAFYPVSRIGFPASDFWEIDLTPSYTREGPDCMDSMLLGVPVETNPAQCEAASPVNYVSEQCPPLYLAHGRKDTVVPYTHSVRLYERYIEKNPTSKIRFILKDEAGHDYHSFKMEEDIHALIDFFEMQRKN